jgi:hypothetical protein
MKVKNINFRSTEELKNAFYKACKKNNTIPTIIFTKCMEEYIKNYLVENELSLKTKALQLERKYKSIDDNADVIVAFNKDAIEYLTIEGDSIAKDTWEHVFEFHPKLIEVAVSKSVF